MSKIFHSMKRIPQSFQTKKVGTINRQNITVLYFSAQSLKAFLVVFIKASLVLFTFSK